MRHDTRKIHDENPLITRGLYGGGGGGGGGGDSSGPGIGGAGIGIGAGDVGIGAGIGTGIGGASSVSGAGMGDVGSGIGSGIGAVGGGVGGPSPGTIASVANTVAGLFGMGIPGLGPGIGPGAVIGATAALGNAINGVTGFGGGTPGIGTGDPGSASSPGGGMARAGINGYGYNEYGQYGYYDPHEGWVAAPGGMLAYMSGLTPQSQQEAQDWANNGFNPQAYLAANPDVANDPYYRSRPWEHYYTHGAREGRSPGGAAPAPAPAAAPAAAPAGPAAVNPNSPDAIRQAQLELVQQQRDIATQMQQRQQALQDQLMAAQGYEPDGAGGYRLNATAQAAADQQNQIAAQLRQRTLDALAGNLPVDPALERGLGEQRRTLEATLRGNLGTGFATSTPGIEALANFDKRAEELRAQQRHDQLTTAEGLRLAGSQVSSTASTQNLANILGITNAGSVPAGLLSSAAGGLSPIGSNLLGYSSLDNALRIAQLTGQNSQSELAQRLAAQDNAGYGSLVGQLGSAFLRSDYAGDLIKNVGSGLGSLWESIGSLF